ncbi:hypothetical protein BSK20_04220 [SR1 bacterium human oral taxon HOT-345]|nr:hypothetical protein BSK20_04220 [SR1 bacterium human oral taxon HOT-345]
MKKLLIALIAALLALLLSPGVEFRFGGEEKGAEKSDFSLSSDWFEHVENVTGTIVQMPNPDYLKNYESSLQNSPRIQLQTYEFTEKHLKLKLKKLAENGVKIQIMIENKKYQQFKNTYKELQNYFSGLQNIEVKSDEHLPTQYLHSKITLMQSGFWIQSSNLTHSTFAKNREHLFRSENQEVLKSLHTLFEKDRKGEQLLPSDLHPNLVVCNLNCRAVITELISGAKESIIMQTQYLNDPALFDLIAKKSETLNFKAIFSDTETNQSLPDYFGTHQVRLMKKPYVHTKMILIDKKILLLGSMNLSANSLDNNREIGILLIDPKLIEQFLSEFRADWEAIKHPSPTSKRAKKI